MTPLTMKVQPFVRSRRRLLSLFLVIGFCLSCDATATDSFILLSDGSHLKAHSRSSASISSSLGYRTPDRSSRITGLDYAGSSGDSVPIAWLEARGLMTGTVDLMTKNLSQVVGHRESIPFPVSHLAFDRSSCLRHLLLVPEDGTGIWKYETQSKDLTPLVTNVTAVSRVYAANGDVYWMEGNNSCLFKREIISHPKTTKETVACLIDGDTLVSAFVRSSGRVVYLLSANGDVYRAAVGDSGSMRRIFSAAQFKNRKFLKYEVNEFDGIGALFEEHTSDLKLFVSIRNHGILVEITTACMRTSPESRTECLLSNIRDEVNENKLYDFKLLSDPGINCSEEADTIRTQVLMDRLRNAGFGSISDGAGTILVSWVIVYVVLSMIFLVLVCKLVHDLVYKKRGERSLTDLLKGRDDRRQMLRRSPSSASLSHSNSQHALNFPPKNLMPSPTARLDPCLNRTISIEDLTGFSNPSFDVVPRRGRTASQKSCGSCDYREECKELGVCLTTYSLLHQ